MALRLAASSKSDSILFIPQRYKLISKTSIFQSYKYNKV
jgi:hypothetical protein